MTLLTLFILLTSFSVLCFDITKGGTLEYSYTKCPNKCIDLEIGLDVSYVYVCVCEGYVCVCVMCMCVCV